MNSAVRLESGKDINRAASLYLDLIKRSLIDVLRPTQAVVLESDEIIRVCPPVLMKWLDIRNLQLCRQVTFCERERIEGRDWPAHAETMIGMQRLDNLQELAVDVLRKGVPGDFMEAGVWRGGAAIFMKAILAAFGDDHRRVWLADSFEGVPPPEPDRYPADDPHTPWGELWKARELSVSQDIVKANFARYCLLDERVLFLAGWFRDTLPDASVEQLALLRLDGDMYESTWISLNSLYKKIAKGGYIIVDDYGAIDACRQAVDDYRHQHSICEPIKIVDWTSIYWQID